MNSTYENSWNERIIITGTLSSCEIVDMDLKLENVIIITSVHYNDISVICDLSRQSDIECNYKTECAYENQTKNNRNDIVKIRYCIIYKNGLEVRKFDTSVHYYHISGGNLWSK